MEALSVSDYRKQPRCIVRPSRRGGTSPDTSQEPSLRLVSVGREELTLSPKQQRQVNEFAESLRRSWEQVKQMESGAIPAKSAMDFINEL